MAASEARIAANRANASKSTGPRTPGGKARSRANSLRHGLAARVLRTSEEAEALGDSPARPPLEPASSPLGRAWVVDQIRLIALRIDRAGAMELRLRERLAARASQCWDIERRSRAEALGSKIRRDPSGVASGLEETPQGCLWMIERWAMLARIADRDQAWSPMAEQVAFDLLGVPLELRGGPAREQIDTEGQLVDQGPDLAAFARRNIDRLEGLRESLADADAHDRATAQAGLAVDLGPEGLRLARYDAELHRRLRWFHALLEQMPDADPHPEALEEAPPPGPRVDPGPEPDPESDPEPAPTPQAPPLLVPSRKQRRADRAEARRLAAERKLLRRIA